MTLRLRLVLGLVVLVAAGLTLFGVTTYTLYSRSQYKRLDQQIISSQSAVDRALDEKAGLNLQPPTGDTSFAGVDRAPGQGGPGGLGGGPPAVLAPGTYAELIDSSGKVLSEIVLSTGSARPKLPSPLPAASSRPRLLTVGADTGSGQFRALVAQVPATGPTSGGPGPRDGAGSDTIVIAVPLTDVTNALHRLVLQDAAGSLALLLALSIGSWLILRRGLRPLERMATTARSISAGDLSQRVSPSGGPSEVGQLGLALNTMLVDIEAAFQEREATELRLRQFLADASHELRTPLTSIQGFAELFRVSGENARVDLPTILRRIEQESARMKVLVEDLLLLAQLDQPRVAERVPVDLAVLAADACSDAVATAPDRPITLNAPEPVVVAGDQAHLRQAIANLVTNAVHHTAPGTPIEVGAHLNKGSAVVVVRDHGNGLDEEAQAHIFDRFWRADKARVGLGVGLGLAIVAGIAAEHGGTASAANAEGGGAVFTLRLPLGAPAR